MNYRIKPGSIVIAVVRETGETEMKTVSKEKIYKSAYKDGDYFVFGVKQPSRWKEFRALRSEVEVQVDIDSVPDGTYTVVFGDDTFYVTVKIETDLEEKRIDGSPNFFYGRQIVRFLSGPDNENNFTGFAHIDEDGAIHVWKRWRSSSNQPTENIQKYLDAVVLLQKSGGEFQEESGMKYALRSGRCRKCNRTLTVPASLHRGMGPVCSKGGTDG